MNNKAAVDVDQKRSTTKRNSQLSKMTHVIFRHYTEAENIDQCSTSVYWKKCDAMGSPLNSNRHRVGILATNTNCSITVAVYHTQLVTLVMVASCFNKDIKDKDKDKGSLLTQDMFFEIELCCDNLRIRCFTLT